MYEQMAGGINERFRWLFNVCVAVAFGSEVHHEDVWMRNL
jgi:hypothetical protein